MGRQAIDAREICDSGALWRAAHDRFVKNNGAPGEPGAP
jgi:hypothetical protein